MEAIFNGLKGEGKNNVENLVKWMKDSNVIGAEQVDKALTIFNDVPDPKNISLETFTDIIKKIAAEFSIDLGGLTDKLGEEGSKLLQSLLEGDKSEAVEGNTDEAVEGNTEEAVEGNSDEDDDHPKA